LDSAAAAFLALGTADSSRAGPFDSHAEIFLRDLAEARNLIRARITALGPDLPFENGSMRRLVEGDLAAQRIAHAHDILQRALKVVSRTVPAGNPDTNAGAKLPATGGRIAPVASPASAVVSGGDIDAMDIA
jgi:hypothetical protein